MMHIEVICTGDEVLTGKIVNSNFSYMAQKLEDYGFPVKWGVTVGDDRTDLLDAFRQAGERAGVVIVNGGLGPTVDDLSQEVAAQAAGVELELHEGWLAHMRAFFEGRGRIMPENNVKQAMLPVGAEMIDNPVGTACGFAVTIGKARFYFTPGVPRELRRMLEQEIIPRLLEKSGGGQGVIHLKRFHSFGLGESHVDSLLQGLEELVPDGSLKLGFRAHYPQLETKLTIRGASEEEVATKLAPVIEEVRRRMGNFILAEDDETLEGVVLSQLAGLGGTLAVVENFSGGLVASRFSTLPGFEEVMVRGAVMPRMEDLMNILYADGRPPGGEGHLTNETAETAAQTVRTQYGATHGLAVLVELAENEDGPPGGANTTANPTGGNLNGNICIGIATEDGAVSRRSRLLGNRDWVRLGAVEMGLDTLRRHLMGLPLKEKTDFERAAPN